MEAKSTTKPTIYIGIDPGVNTGLAYWCKADKNLQLETKSLHRAFEWVKNFSLSGDCLVRIEDARLRKYFGNSGREKLQGAGSIKRDCKAWEDFLTDMNIKFELVSPKQKGAKVTADYFKKLTGYNKKSSQHARDAGLLVFGL